MLRPILRLGDSILTDPARPVEAITPEIKTLIDDMIETMYAAPGIGLAAPQIGVSLRIFVVDLSVGRDPAGLSVMLSLDKITEDHIHDFDLAKITSPDGQHLLHNKAYYTVNEIPKK